MFRFVCSKSGVLGGLGTASTCELAGSLSFGVTAMGPSELLVGPPDLIVR
jgi:hypothetical protein